MAVADYLNLAGLVSRVANPMKLVVMIPSLQLVFCSVNRSHFIITRAHLEPQQRWYYLSEPYRTIPCSGKVPESERKCAVKSAIRCKLCTKI